MMYNNDADLLFPLRALPALTNLRGESWQALVQSVRQAAPKDIEALGFTLMMARLAHCASCDADSFRALRGCPECARQVIRRYRGSDESLIQLYKDACWQVRDYLHAAE